MPLSTPEITVLIPTRDRWELLSLTLAGALAQRDVELEVLVVDDGSTDGTTERLAQLGDPRVRHIRNDSSIGVTRARNRGIAEAHGQWIALLDDDDLWSPRKLREQLDIAVDTGATFVYSAAAQLERGEVREINAPPPAAGAQAELLSRCVIPSGCSNVIVSAEAIRAVSGFDERLRMMADWDLWIRLASTGQAADCQETHVAYVIHDSNMHSDQALGHIDELRYIDEKFRAERADSGVEIDGASFTRWIGGAAWRAGDRRTAWRIYMHGARKYRKLGNVARAGAAVLHLDGLRPERRSESASGPDLEWLPLYRPGGAIAEAGASIARIRDR